MTDKTGTRIQTESDAGYTPVGRSPAQSKIQNPKSKIDADYADMPEELRKEAELASESRRDFMKVTGMAAMGAVIAGCAAEERHVNPLRDKPEGVTPGVRYQYAGTCPGCSANCGTLMTVRDGRPIKPEGNPEHPLNRGSLCAIGQAQLWTLYNPDRLKAPQGKDGDVEWGAIDRAARSAVKAGDTVLLTGTVNGPAIRDAIRRFADKTGARHVAYDAVSCHAIEKAHGETHGKAVVPQYHFDRARLVINFDADFLGAWISPVEHAAGWGKGRDLKFGKDNMSRLLSFEARMSLTGANADERWRVKESERGAVLADLANRLGGNFGTAGNHGVPAEDLDRIVKELRNNAGEALVVSGSTDVKQQVVANWINHELGAYGRTLDLATHSRQKLGNDDDLNQLMADLEGGNVKTLIVWGANPVYDLPEGEKFKAALKKVDNKIAIARHADETAALCDWIAAEDDPLESWNDFEPVKGLYSLNQAMVRRLWNTREAGKTLLTWAEDSAGSGHWRNFIKDYWEANVLPAGRSWNHAVELGVIDRRNENSDAQPDYRNADAGKGTGAIAKEDGLEIVTFESYNLRDGRHATNGWLHEMADPMSRVAWTNLALMTPKTMKVQGVEEGDIVDVTAKVNGRDATCRVPVMRQPGMAEGTVAISLGYGRTKAGKISHGMGIEEDAVDPDKLDDGVYQIGGNAWPLRSSAPVFGGISKAGRDIRLAKISKHDSQEQRPILKQTSLEEWKKNPAAGNQQDLPPDELTVWPKWEYKGHKWGMVVDLNSCMGCNACLIACNVENNIPVVGKEEVWRRREMHWIRIDRYYEDNDGSLWDGELTKEDNPEVGFQPMMCQHCENAPCETVCPVIATSHSEEGLNVQTYNRCIGTRYCANNCPYKVRRFNWFMYKWRDLTMNLVLNPDLTVRSQGVMEKCSMCAQRIYGGKREAALEGKAVEDGDITPACAQTCPTDAIIFGDENNENSRVAKLKKDPRNYAVLAEINTRPAVTYLTKVRNRPTKHEHERAKKKAPANDGHGH